MVGYSTILMLAVTGCYTITSLSDKYAAAKARFSGNEFTFLMCSSMSVFLLLTLFLIAVGMFPFVDMKIYREKAAGTIMFQLMK